MAASPVAERLYRKRSVTNAIALAFAGIATLLGLFFLAWILWTTLSKGFGAINPGLFTKMTPPPGEKGGLLNAIAGTVLLSFMGIAIATPIGIAAGTYLAEYAKLRTFGETVRFMNDILLSAPSIVLGMFVYTLVVLPTGKYSAIAGGVALALIALPVIVRTSDEMLRLVPGAMREAALSLGVPQWKVTVQVLYRSALPGITTGVLLALARITGETAPLLFTAFGNQYWSMNPTKPIASLPVVVYQYAQAPDEGWNQLAWAGALLITLFVLLLSILARGILLRNKASNE
ncbi:MAG TPA: phosphate ABC transporter permease PstA [Xanthomonadaceae bacterium]|nr:phosphate ABC transporter permease PstA [Xanthomonadaceae bacterium]